MRSITFDGSNGRRRGVHMSPMCSESSGTATARAQKGVVGAGPSKALPQLGCRAIQYCVLVATPHWHWCAVGVPPARLSLTGVPRFTPSLACLCRPLATDERRTVFCSLHQHLSTRRPVPQNRHPASSVPVMHLHLHPGSNILRSLLPIASIARPSLLVAVAVAIAVLLCSLEYDVVSPRPPVRLRPYYRSPPCLFLDHPRWFPIPFAPFLPLPWYTLPSQNCLACR